MITFAIPTFNNGKTLMKCIDGILNQNIKCCIKIMDNDSKDGSLEMIQTAIKNKWFGEVDIKISEAPDRVRKLNILLMRYKLAQSVDTEFIMFIDADVILYPNTVSEMLKEFKENTGMMGVCYVPYTDHVRIGATIMRSEVAKKINWRMDKENCECKNCANQLKEMGLETIGFKGATAQHLKN